MIKNQHKSEYFIEIVGLEDVLFGFEKRDEDIVLPVIIKFTLFFINFIYLNDVMRKERSKSILH